MIIPAELTAKHGLNQEQFFRSLDSVDEINQKSLEDAAFEFATIANMLSPSQPIQPGAEDKLATLRRLDQSRAWNSLDDQLYCTICKNVISGRQIEVVGGTNGLRALHIKCSTPGCVSTPADWLFPVKSDTVRDIDFLFRDNGV